MIREKIEALMRKNYLIEKIAVSAVLYNEDSLKEDINNKNTYFFKVIYTQKEGFNNKYYIPDIDGNTPKHKINKISTTITINFLIEITKLNFTEDNYKIENLLEKITEDVIESLKINSKRKSYSINNYYSNSFIYSHESPEDNQTTITLYHGTTNFSKNLESRPDLLKGIIDIVKTKHINKYL